MNDILKGTVKKIIDGNTFVLDSIRSESNNKNNYHRQEIINIASINTPEWYEPGGTNTNFPLANKLNGKLIRCEVLARDAYGRLVCDIVGINDKV